eukprot:TRINITY_DN1629_c0_g3_i1.p1 TRINITY_DN1629_c0_g3~~TRINITY_DN1629_c0_g3_i1.p1  ORF type:complete len:220 (-),score=33.56 TRINITY_DN1629_c0_g3_i1:22-681(-)
MEGYKVIPLSPTEHLEAITPLLTEAFFDDPKFKEMFPDNSQRKYELSWLFERMVWMKAYREDSFHFVVVCEKTDRVVGCIFLTPLGAHTSFWLKVQAGLLVAPYYIGWRNFQTMMSISSFIDGVENQYFEETGANRSDYFLISHVAISPEHQGKGLGKMLVNFVIDHSRSKGRSLLLGTAKLSNVEFYKKCGFKLEKTQSIEGKALGMPIYEYLMTRKM